MPIEDSQHAYVPKEKLVLYVLNHSHPIGHAKARLFAGFGYSLERPDILEKDLLNLLKSSENFVVHKNAYGIKYIVRGSIATPSGKQLRIYTVWIREPGEDRLRFVTAYPSKDEGYTI